MVRSPVTLGRRKKRLFEYILILSPGALGNQAAAGFGHSRLPQLKSERWHPVS